MHLLLVYCCCFFSVNVGISPLAALNVYIHKFPRFSPPAPLIFPSPSSFFSFFHYDFISLTTLHSDPSGRFLQHFNRALKITISSFIHTGFAIMQPLWAGRLEVNPLSHHHPYKLLSDSSAPNTEANLTSLPLVCHPHTSLGFPHPSFKGKNLHKISVLKEETQNI